MLILPSTAIFAVSLPQVRTLLGKAMISLTLAMMLSISILEALLPVEKILTDAPGTHRSKAATNILTEVVLPHRRGVTMNNHSKCLYQPYSFLRRARSLLFSLPITRSATGRIMRCMKLIWSLVGLCLKHVTWANF